MEVAVVAGVVVDERAAVEVAVGAGVVVDEWLDTAVVAADCYACVVVVVVGESLCWQWWTKMWC